VTLATRLRGWAADHTSVEQRLKDLETFADSLRRRWLMIGTGTLLLALGRVMGVVPAPPSTIAAVVMGASVLNLMAGTALRRGWYRWWQIYALALFDLALAAALVVFYGPGGFIAAFYLAVLPYTFDQGRGVGDFLILTGSLGYLGAVALHGLAFRDGAAAILTPQVYFETIVFILVAAALKRIPSTLIERIRLTRAVMGQAEQGYLAVRAPAQRSDELGFLEKSLNRMLTEIAGTISQVQREADEVAAFADVLADASERMLESSRNVATSTADLAAGMTEQQSLAQTGHGASTEAARAAGSLRSRAEQSEADTRRLVEAAARGRDSVGRAGQTLLSIGRDVRATATTVQELSGLSERIGTFNRAIATIARQTHLLALNAAIEAARAEEHGEGFAAVAEQVRTLAREAGQSARDVAELIATVRSGIDAVAQAMATGAARVRDVGTVADEAQRALEDLHAGTQQAAELVTATAAVSRTQAERMAGLAERISRMAQISDRSATMAADASAAMRSQMEAMQSLHRTGRQLAELADRLRAGIARFSVLHPDHTTSEHRIPP
jgi:methyl-accepting chemotaxis protein